jgi:hypothetical protein
VSLAEFACDNCKRTGGIIREVYRVHTVTDSYFKCSSRKSSVITLPCPHCQTDLVGLFKAE